MLKTTWIEICGNHTWEHQVWLRDCTYIQEIGVEDDKVEAERKCHGAEQVRVHPWGHQRQGLILRDGVQGVGHLNGDEHRQGHSHGLGGLENLAGKSLEVLGVAVAAHVVGKLVVGHLGAC